MTGDRLADSYPDAWGVPDDQVLGRMSRSAQLHGDRAFLIDMEVHPAGARVEIPRSEFDALKARRTTFRKLFRKHYRPTPWGHRPPLWSAGLLLFIAIGGLILVLAR